MEEISDLNAVIPKKNIWIKKKKIIDASCHGNWFKNLLQWGHIYQGMSLAKLIVTFFSCGFFQTKMMTFYVIFSFYSQPGNFWDEEL